MIFLGADHRGFELKETLKKRLLDDGLEIEDLGDAVLNPTDDYVDFARDVATRVSKNPGSFGILLCGSGAGVDIVANKIDGVRSALVYDVDRAIQAREHEDANVISLPADILDGDKAYEIITKFLNTEFTNEERHQRRLEKIEQIEEEN